MPDGEDETGPTAAGCSQRHKPRSVARPSVAGARGDPSGARRATRGRRPTANSPASDERGASPVVAEHRLADDRTDAEPANTATEK